MEHPTKKRAICVLGMHRSGTSALTRAINLLDVYLGKPERMIPDDLSNPAGFWEHIGIVDCHERILRTLSRTWYDVNPFPEQWWHYPELQSIKNELLTVVKNEFDGIALWGWKDPRTCLMLPIWDEIADVMNVDIDYVFIIRNPLDVANSLSRRDGLLQQEAFMLWQLHTLLALRNTKKRKRIIIHYDRLISDWKFELKKISAFLEISWPNDDQLLTNRINSFLRPSLRHSQASMSDLESAKEAEPSVIRAYRYCLEAVEDVKVLNSEEFIRSIEDLYQEYLSYVRNINMQLLNALKLKNEYIQERNERLRVKYAEIGVKDRHIRIQDQQIRMLQQTIQETYNTMSWKITMPMRWVGELLIRVGVWKKGIK